MIDVSTDAGGPDAFANFVVVVVPALGVADAAVIGAVESAQVLTAEAKLTLPEFVSLFPDFFGILRTLGLADVTTTRKP